MHGPEVEGYRYPPDCPFLPQRAGMLADLLRRQGLLEGAGVGLAAVVPAPVCDLLTFHRLDYVEALRRVSGGDFCPGDLAYGLGMPETPVFPDLYGYALMACGASLGGADLLRDGGARRVFNPTGGFHHARAAEAEGFCYLNDMVLAAERLAREGGRVFCLDLDAHHGNGTQEAFWRRRDVLTVSFHESGHTLFPWGGFEDEIGEGDGLGFNVNVPLPAGCDDRAFTLAFQSPVPPLLDAFRPDAILLEVGMDVLAVDPLAHLSLTNNATADAVGLLASHGAPILATGGGGYHAEATVRGWALVFSLLSGGEETDLTAGLGGVFLGTGDWGPGLRDPGFQRGGEEEERVLGEVRRVIDRIGRDVFPLHGI
jgi:acetoin utilization protein AcuC